MQKDLFKHVNQQLSEKMFDDCSFYRLSNSNTFLCIHKADCWEKSFIVFLKNDEVRVMKGETYEWLDSVTTNRGEIAKWFNAESIGLINGEEVTSVDVNDGLKNAVLKCLEEIGNK